MKLESYRNIVRVSEYVFDAITLYCTCVFSYFVWQWLDQFAFLEFIEAGQDIKVYWKFWVVVTGTTMISYRYFGLYKLQKSILNIRELEGIFKGTLLSFLIILALIFFFKTVVYARVVVVITFILIFFFMLLERYGFLKLNQFFMKKRVGPLNVIIYGAGEVGRRLKEKFDQSPKLGYNLIGFIDDKAELAGQEVSKKSNSNINVKVIGNFNNLSKIVKEHKVDRIFVAMPNVSKEKIVKIVDVCHKNNSDFKIVPSLYDIMIQKIRLTEIDGIPLISVREPKYKKSTIVFKRVLDLACLLALLPFALPLSVIIAIAIKRDSQGSVLFKQNRVGKNGKVFALYKFRTMHVATNPYEVNPQKITDPRITKVGRWLRRSSLDELPQLINVLKWDMNLVGPRPEMEFIVKKYNSLQRDRLNVRPGITGLWQVSADRELAIHENMDYDIYYIDNQSVLLDVVIMIRTFFSAVKGIGAY